MQRIQIGAPDPVFLDDPEAIASVANGMRRDRLVALDTETTGLDIMRDVPLFACVSTEEKRIVIPASRLPCLGDLLNDEAVTVAMHNAKFDLHMLANVGVTVKAKAHCTLTMAGMSDSSRSSLKLKDLAIILYGADDPDAMRYKDFTETFGRPGRGKTAGDLLLEAPIEKVADYVANDAWVTVRAHKTLQSQLKRIINWREITLWNLFEEIEVPFTRLLWDCERAGIRVDAEKLEGLKKEWSGELERLEREFASLAGRPINLNSTPQLRQYFLLDKKLTTDRFTKGGESGELKQSVDKVTLKSWADAGVQEAAIMLRHREIGMLLRTFVVPLLEKRDPFDRVHGTFNQVGAETGRLSSSDPNLQNIPVRTELGRLIRACFIAEDGRTFVVRDYDQLEMRLAAGLSGDERMIAIIRAGKDIHAGNAAIAFGTNYDDIMAAVALKGEIARAKKEGREPPKMSDYLKACLEARQRAKTIGFGVLYGEGIYKLALQLGVTVDDAKRIRGRFFSAFPKLIAYVNRTHREVEETLYVQTLLGRIRSLPAAALGDSPAYYKALRQAFNTKVQGTAADVAKLAMLRIWRDARLRTMQSRLLLQVHDELLSETPKQQAAEAGVIIGKHMEESIGDITVRGRSIRLAVRLTAGGSEAENWAEAK